MQKREIYRRFEHIPPILERGALDNRLFMPTISRNAKTVRPERLWFYCTNRANSRASIDHDDTTFDPKSIITILGLFPAVVN